ncbi:MAG: hypothetical protein Q9169_004655 [Polycauliona sp. 2 TL-2023]
MSKSPNWSVIVHGGCSNSCLDVETQQAIRRDLVLVRDTAVASLKAGATAKDVVLHAVAALEDCPPFNAGKGAALTIEGDYELEAGLIDGHSGAYGAVSCVMTTKNPILAADDILQRGAHCMLVGNAADGMAQKAGLESVPNTYFETATRRAYWASTIQNRQSSVEYESGTVGAVALDIYGHIAAGGSTGGVSGKDKGRVGDTAVLGAGLFADSKLGVACSGAGDEILRQLLATKVANQYSRGFDVETATRRAVSQFALTGKPCAVIGLDNRGQMSVQSTAQSFSTASACSDHQHQPTMALRCTTYPVLPQHVFFRGQQIIAGLSRFPTTRGQSLVTLNQPGVHLFSLDRQDFLDVMTNVKYLARTLHDFYNVGRCALVTEGNGSVSIIPPHGLEKPWEPITSDEKEFQETFPGYVSSKDGPAMEPERLAQISAMIRQKTRLEEPWNYRFKGDHGDSNLFARLVRGELPQSRVWEDGENVAFLTPFANTPGFTVLVPREHFSSDIFSIDDTDYANLMDASYTLAGHLMKAFGVTRCGMIFEGFEIDYAHVKIMPIHSCGIPCQSLESGPSTKLAPYNGRYPGHVTSLNGPFLQDQEPLLLDASSLRKMIRCERVQPPQSWKSPQKHATAVLSEMWYKNLFTIQDSLFHSSVSFFKQGVNYKYAFVPATTNAISSPMGLGSDSEPVPINLLGQKTYLADSMQFALEYALRIEDGLDGVYYVNTSFRGEDSDAMHLNQFYHVECELAGDYDKGIAVAERYLVSVISSILRDHSHTIEALAGTVDHLTAFLDLYRQYDQNLPRVTLDEALNLRQMDETCWKYVVPENKAHGRTINRVGEQKLIQHFGGAVWLTEMDHLSVPFYQAYVPATSGHKARCADLLLGNGEVLGMGERHVTSTEVRHALK